MKINASIPLTASLALGLLSLTAQGGPISWGGAFFTNNYSADGTALESGATAAVASGEVSYQLGIFKNSDGSQFTPTAANTGQWAANWYPLTAADTSITSASADYDAAQNYFGNNAAVGSTSEQIPTVSGPATGGSIVYGYQAYIWGYDTKAISLTEKPEWFLVTGKSISDGLATTSQNWLVPDSSASNNGTFTVNWDIASASVAIVGQIDNNKGGGEMTDPPVSFEESDHQFASIPEPSSALLSLLAGLALLRRRR